MQLKEIHSFDEVPSFENEEQEAEFWATHSLSDELLSQMGPVPEEILPIQRRTKPVAIRFDQHTIHRLKVLAEKQHKGYQTLLKEFVTERLYEEEKREGIIQGSARYREGTRLSEEKGNGEADS